MSNKTMRWCPYCNYPLDPAHERRDALCPNCGLVTDSRIDKFYRYGSRMHLDLLSKVRSQDGTNGGYNVYSVPGIE